MSFALNKTLTCQSSFHMGSKSQLIAQDTSPRTKQIKNFTWPCGTNILIPINILQLCYRFIHVVVNYASHLICDYDVTTM
jgi:hypothetical protein